MAHHHGSIHSGWKKIPAPSPHPRLEDNTFREHGQSNVRLSDPAYLQNCTRTCVLIEQVITISLKGNVTAIELYQPGAVFEAKRQEK
ncbi:MAG: hypothetical protein WBC70_08325 [Candidatus Aminicenantales bacterium]